MRGEVEKRLQVSRCEVRQSGEASDWLPPLAPLLSFAQLLASLLPCCS